MEEKALTRPYRLLATYLIGTFLNDSQEGGSFSMKISEKTTTSIGCGLFLASILFSIIVQLLTDYQVVLWIIAALSLWNMFRDIGRKTHPQCRILEHKKGKS